MSTKDDRIELLQGTLDLLILRTLQPGPAHGHSIAKAIERTSDDVLQVEQGSLYPALHRLIKRGWIVAEDGTSENNRARQVLPADAARAGSSCRWKPASGTSSPARSPGSSIPARGRHDPSPARPRRPRSRNPRPHRRAKPQDNIARGMTRGRGALRGACGSSGTPARVKEDVRGVWVPGWLDQLRQDARDATQVRCAAIPASRSRSSSRWPSGSA